MLSGTVPSSNSTSLSPLSRHRPSPSSAPSAASHALVPSWVAKPGSRSREVTAKREPSLDRGSPVSGTPAPLRPTMAAPTSMSPPSHPTLASAATSETPAASILKAKAGSTLSLAAIVAAYKKDGNGDRDLLVALLEAKKMEDKRLAARDNLHAEQFRAQYLHYAYALASTYPPPRFLVHPQQPLPHPHGRPARAGPSSARSRSASVASSSTASITVASAVSPTFGPPHEVSNGKRKRAGSVGKVTREEAMQALRAKIARSTGSSSAPDASTTWKPSTAKAKREQVSNGTVDGDTDDEDNDDDDEEDYEPDDDESPPSPSCFRSHSSLSASPRTPTDPSRPRVPASSSAESQSTSTSKSLAMLLEVVDQEQRGLGFVRPVVTA